MQSGEGEMTEVPELRENWGVRGGGYRVTLKSGIYIVV